MGKRVEIEDDDGDGDDGDDDDETTESTLYDVLMCAPDASEHDLRQAYKQQALHWHPDKNSDPDAEERFKKINAAWSVLSDEHQRAAYDRSLLTGETLGTDNYHFDQAAATARDAWQAFMRAEENERRRQIRRERGFLVGLVSFALWVCVLLAVLWLSAGESAMLFPRALELSNSALGKYPLDLGWEAFRSKALAAVTPLPSAAPRTSRPPTWIASAAAAALRTHTPYLRLAVNASDMRRAPAVGRPKGRGWLLSSQHHGEDIYGRPLDLTTRTFLFAPGEVPYPWPPTGTICANLLRSGTVRQKEWFPDLNRATGGRLRPFALAVVAASECESEFGLPTLAGTTLAALLAAKLTVRVVLGSG